MTERDNFPAPDEIQIPKVVHPPGPGAIGQDFWLASVYVAEEIGGAGRATELEVWCQEVIDRTGDWPHKSEITGWLAVFDLDASKKVLQRFIDLTKLRQKAQLDEEARLAQTQPQEPESVRRARSKLMRHWHETNRG